MRITLVRHGQSLNNAHGDQQRHHDPELTDLGHEQARLLGEWFKNAQDIEEIVRMGSHDAQRLAPVRAEITQIYTSPMQRALQTAKRLSDALNAPAAVWTEIYESGGLYLHSPEGVRAFPGQTRSELEAAYPGFDLPETVTDHGWYDVNQGEEDLYKCYGRAMRVAASLRSQARARVYGDRHILLVSHGNFINALIHALLDNLPSEHAYHWMYNTGLTRIDFAGEGMMLVRYVNRIMHLQPHQVT